MRGLYVGVVVFSFLVALLLAPAAHASQSIPVSGSFYPTTPGPITYDEFFFWDDLIIIQTWEFELTGTFSGIAVVEQMVVIELDTGKVEGLDAVYFTGTVAGESGFYMGLHEWTVVGEFAEGTWQIFIGTRGSANLEGEGTFVTDFETGVGTLSGYIEFDD